MELDGIEDQTVKIEGVFWTAERSFLCVIGVNLNIHGGQLNGL